MSVSIWVPEVPRLEGSTPQLRDAQPEDVLGWISSTHHHSGSYLLWFLAIEWDQNEIP